MNRLLNVSLETLHYKGGVIMPVSDVLTAIDYESVSDLGNQISMSALDVDISTINSYLYIITAILIFFLGCFIIKEVYKLFNVFF